MIIPWKKGYDKPRQHTENQRHFFADKGPSSQSYGFSSSYIWMSWTIKKAEPWKIDAFELWCWRRLLRVSWIAKRPNQSILKEINYEYSLERLILKLKLQYFGHLIGKDPEAGKDWRQKEKSMAEDEMLGRHHRLSGHELGQTPGNTKGQRSLVCCSLWGCKEWYMT